MKLSDFNLLGDEKLFKPSEVAQILGVSERTVYQWLRSKKIKGIKYGGLWRVKKSDLLNPEGSQDEPQNEPQYTSSDEKKNDSDSGKMAA